MIFRCEGLDVVAGVTDVDDTRHASVGEWRSCFAVREECGSLIKVGGGDLEEQRISRMYLNLIKKRIEQVWDGISGGEGRRTGFLPALVILVILGGTGAVYVAHRHAKFHELKERISDNGATTPGAENRPGGRDPIVLTRRQTLTGYVPEFHTVTLLPGLGLSVLQITAYLPNKGDQPLLVAPTIPQMTDSSWPVRAGANDMHGALEAPWSGALVGATLPTALTMSVQWNGKMISVPVQQGGSLTVAEGGLLQNQDADSAEVKTLDKGAALAGRFTSRDFDGHWPSTTDVSVSVALKETTLELTVNAKNVGDQPEPMGVGWHPRFALQGSRRDQIELKLPNGEKLELGDGGTPNGKFGAIGSGAEKFIGHAASLRDEALDVSEVRMKGGDSGTSAEILNPAAGYGLRMILVSSGIRELRASAPAHGDYVSLGAQTNLDDPFGHGWADSDSPIATLQPGQSLEWKVRLEIFPVPAR
jgi:aldose 1-epimerase